MSSLIHTVYASKAAPGFEEHEIPALLEKSRAANARCGVTGMLLHIEGSFFQVLEGEDVIVAELFESIGRDPRHTRVTRIIHEPIVARDFTQWTMGFASLAGDELDRHLGENDFFTAATCLEQLGAGRAKKLLDAFRNGRWRAEQTGLHRVHSRVS
jgi:Sensors of blue-light using FAD